MFYKAIFKKLEFIEEFLKNYGKEILIILEKRESTDTNTNKSINLLLSKIENIELKLNSIYFDNQTIKHQLHLENELKKTLEDIDNLSKIIHNTIENINYTIYNLEKVIT